MEKDQAPDRDSIRRWIDGQASPDETQRIETWLAQQGPGPMLDDMDQAWLQASAPMPSDRSRILLGRIRQTIDATTKDPLHVVRDPKKIHRRTWLLAASLIPLIAIVTLLFIKKKQTKIEQTWTTIANAQHRRLPYTLPDSTRVWIAPASTLQYRYDHRNREIALQGEAFFDVQKDPVRPFFITAGKMRTTVLGTSFNLEAWPVETRTCIVLLTGSLQATYAKAGGTWDSIRLSPGFSFSYDRENFTTSQDSSGRAAGTDWTGDHIVVHELPLSDALNRIGSYYGKKITLVHAPQGRQLLSAVLPAQDLHAAMDNLAFVYRLEYRIANDTVYVSAR